MAVRAVLVVTVLCLAATPAWSRTGSSMGTEAPHTAKHANSRKPVKKPRRPRAHPRRTPNHTRTAKTLLRRAPAPHARSASTVTPAPNPVLSYLSIGGAGQCAWVPSPISFTQLRLLPSPSEAVVSTAGTEIAELVTDESEPLKFIGLLETSSGDLRVAVLRVNGRVVYGRQGEVVAGRYRLLGFSDEGAHVFDLNASVRRTLALGSQ
jgi:hypothetical protein